MATGLLGIPGVARAQDRVRPEFVPGVLFATEAFAGSDFGTGIGAGVNVSVRVLPRVAVHWSYAWVVPRAVLITFGVTTLVVVGIRNGRLQARHLLSTAAVLAFGTVGAVVFAALLWIAVRTVNTDYQMTLVGAYQTEVCLVALALATIALMATISNALSRAGSEYAVTGAMLAWLPRLWAPTPPGRRSPSSGVGGLPALVLLSGTLHQAVGLLNRFEDAAGLPVFGLTMVFVAPAVLLLVPQLDMLGGGAGTRSLGDSGGRWYLCGHD